MNMEKLETKKFKFFVNILKKSKNHPDALTGGLRRSRSALAPGLFCFLPGKSACSKGAEFSG